MIKMRAETRRGFWERFGEIFDEIFLRTLQTIGLFIIFTFIVWLFVGLPEMVEESKNYPGKWHCIKAGGNYINKQCVMIYEEFNEKDNQKRY